jgi:hypothetical protein
MQTEAQLKLFPSPPTWNPWNMRPLLSQCYSDAYLQHHLELNPNVTHLQACWKQQKPLCSQDYYGNGYASSEQLAK